MSIEALRKKKEKVVKLQGKVERLRKAEEDLHQAEIDYYREYYKTDRPLFSRLTDIPEEIQYEDFGLADNAILCVDTVGRIIRDLIRRYEHEDVVGKRTTTFGKFETSTGDIIVNKPIYVVGRPEDIILGEACYKNVVLPYGQDMDCEHWPTNHPVYWEATFEDVCAVRSNYNYLFGGCDGLAFNIYDREYIKEFIYSLAYHQKQMGITQMGQRDTWNVYEQILYRNLKK